MEIVYTPKEAAKILKISEETVKRHLRDGRLVGFKAGNRWRIKESALKAYMQANGIEEQ